MSLAPGTRIGSYEIVSMLGAGGMGEVYRAHDTKLGRDVALKIVPELFASDRDRLARFTREAQTLAALNHPNIAHIHGLEESGGMRALVMELVEGEDLAQRLVRGPLPPDEALPIARQLAEALETAHEQGIIHRDLKPANIKIRDDGTVKVLDFGLAKALAGDVPGSSSGASGVANSPTLTSPAMTGVGVILGTAAYMAPEQARGKPVDRRADIWAFGVVLFEMLTRRRAFDADDVSDVLASVLKTDPDWTLLPADLPSPVRRLLGRCLEKDPKRRLRDIGEGMLQLDEGLSTAEAAASAPARTMAIPGEAAGSGRTRRSWRHILPFMATAVVTALAVWAIMSLRSPPRASPGVVRFTYLPPLGAPLMVTPGGRDIAITPDGRTLVYTARPSAESTPQLYLRPADQLGATPLRGAENAVSPFVSPDGQWVGFVESTISQTSARIKKVSILGGPAIVVAQLPDLAMAGATWLTDGTIVLATTRGLKKIAPTGAVTDVTTSDPSADERAHAWPSAVSGSTMVLFAITPVSAAARPKIAVVDVSNGRMVRLPIEGTGPRYASTGHIVYAGPDGSLSAVPFDLKRLAVTGPSAIVLEGVVVKPSGASNFDLSSDGQLVYSGGGLAAERSLLWVDRAGQETPMNAPPRAYFYPRVSRGGRIVLDVRDQERDIWILDSRGTLNRLTAKKESAEEYGLWTPDGQRVIFVRRLGQKNGIFWTRADGIGEPELLVDQAAFPNAVTADGQTLIFRALSSGAEGSDILAVSLAGDRKVTTLIATDRDELNAALSPDNQWMAYQSNLSGRMEIYVRPFPNVDGGQTLISTSGGTEPLWAPDGREIFYRSADNKLMSAAVTARDELVAETPKLLFDMSRYATYIGRNYDITPDGKRFVMVKAPSTSQPSLTIVLNWIEELKRIK